MKTKIEAALVVGAIVGLLSGCGPADETEGRLAQPLVVPTFSLSPRHENAHVQEGAATPFLTGQFTVDRCADAVYAKASSIVSYASDCVGGFGARTVTTIASMTGRVPRAADFDGDGADDVAYVAQTKVRVFFSNRDGTFRAGPDWTLGANEVVESVGRLTFDVNYDGKADLLFVAPTVRWYLGNGDGTFGPRNTQASPNIVDAYGNAVSMAKVNESFVHAESCDSLVPALYAYGADKCAKGVIGTVFYSGKVSDYAYGVVRLTGPVARPVGQIRPTLINFYAKSSLPMAKSHVDEGDKFPFVGDFTGDGLDDVAYVGPSSIAGYVSDGATTFADRVNVTHFNETTRDARIADVNGDGTLDFVYGAGSAISVYFSGF